MAGLLTLRERHHFTVHATAEVQSVIAANSIFRVLSPDCVEHRVLPLDSPTALSLPDGSPSGLEVTAFAVPGKVALWLEDKGRDPGIVEDGHTVGLEVREIASEKSLFFIPGCAAMTERLARRLRGASLVFFDGTLWRDDEMIRLGVGPKTGQRMGHMSMTGERRHDRGIRGARRRAQDLYPHQQLQPRAARGFARTRRGRGRRLDDRA